MREYRHGEFFEVIRQTKIAAIEESTRLRRALQHQRTARAHAQRQQIGISGAVHNFQRVVVQTGINLYVRHLILHGQHFTDVRDRLQGILHYPAGFEAGKTYPMVVYMYEKLSRNLHNYAVPSDRSPYNPAVFTSKGYFFLSPDITFRPRDPGLSALDAVESAVRRVLGSGHVDPKRVGLVGHSGSGKSTFVKLLQRLYDLHEGRILIDGQEIAHAAQVSLRSQLALVPQEPLLFHRSLAENIAYARPEATLAEIERAAQLANAHDFIIRQPKGYATLVGERGVKLSGGERQRVALARAFLADAPILILDEATSSLDSESEALIQEAMQRLIVGRTAIVIAHRLSTVRSLDRILVFDRGEIVEQGTHAVLTARPGGIYRGLFERQATEFGRITAAE